MGSTMTDLGLSLRPAMAGFFGGISSVAGAVKMEEYVHCLEEERRKIEAFKRELPLCMLILTDVISALKEEVKRRSASPRPVLEQFMPMAEGAKAEEARKTVPDKEAAAAAAGGGDKMNWMSSVQLWSDNSSDECNADSNSNNSNSKDAAGPKRLADERASEADRQSESGGPVGGAGGAFAPFRGLKAAAPDLSLLTPASRNQQVIAKATKVLVSPFAGAQPCGAGSAQQGPRKVRRCWSPELHRRFVGALQQLGGPQAATPKQIRELMKVDGLTNDEVKSHLQKYRLHTRRPAPSNGSANNSAAVLGDLWVPSAGGNYASSNPDHSRSGSESPLRLSAAAHGASLTGVDSCGEEEDDRKSESFSWKGSNQRLEEETE